MQLRLSCSHLTLIRYSSSFVLRHHAAVCNLRGDSVWLELNGRGEHGSRLQPGQRRSPQWGQPGEHHQQRYCSLNLSAHGYSVDCAAIWLESFAKLCSLSTLKPNCPNNKNCKYHTEGRNAAARLSLLLGAKSETSKWQIQRTACHFWNIRIHSDRVSWVREFIQNLIYKLGVNKEMKCVKSEAKRISLHTLIKQKQTQMLICGVSLRW